MDTASQVIALKSETDVAEAVRIACTFCEKMGFGTYERSKIRSAVSEIAGNVIKHANSGEFTINTTRNKKGVEIKIKDKGKGIANIKKAIEDGYTGIKNGNSLGVGLGAAKRAMDEMIVRSEAKKGTKVVLRKFIPIHKAHINYGVVSFPAVGEHFNGDGYVIKEFGGDKVLLAVIDGAGKGKDAHRTALIAKKIIEENHKAMFTTIVRKCDRVLRKEDEYRGCALSLLLLKPRGLEYLGIGNTDITVLSAEKVPLFNLNGTIGKFTLPELRVQKHSTKGKIRIILCTDGIELRRDERILKLQKNTQKQADMIFDKYSKAEDDSTVIVIDKN